jgi:anti-anti-sigma factor
MDPHSPRPPRSGPDFTVITLAGGQTGLADRLAGELAGLTAGNLLLDFSRVEWLASVELGTLVGFYKRLTAAGGRLALCNLTERVAEVLVVTRLDTLLEVWPPAGVLAGADAGGAD